MDLNVLYGTGYSVYGGLLEFRKDKTFSINIGITNDGPSNNGIFSCTDTIISVDYLDGNSSEFTPVFASDGSIESILVPQMDYTVVFVRSSN